MLPPLAEPGRAPLVGQIDSHKSKTPLSRYIAVSSATHLPIIEEYNNSTAFSKPRDVPAALATSSYPTPNTQTDMTGHWILAPAPRQSFITDVVI